MGSFLGRLFWLGGLGDETDEKITIVDSLIKEGEDPELSVDFRVRSLSRAVEILNDVLETAPEGSWAQRYSYVTRDRVSKKAAMLKKQMKAPPPLTAQNLEEATIRVIKDLQRSIWRWNTGQPLASFAVFKSLLPILVKETKELLLSEPIYRTEAMEKGREEALKKGRQKLSLPELLRLMGGDLTKVFYTWEELKSSILGDEDVRRVRESASLKEALEKFTEFPETAQRIEHLRTEADIRFLFEKKKMAESLVRKLAEMDPEKAVYANFFLKSILEGSGT